MSLRPGDLLGLPAPDLVQDLAAFRYAMVALALAWALIIIRVRPLVATLFGTIHAAAGVTFWTLALGRPYGLLIDPHVTRRVAECAVAAASGGWEGILSGQPAHGIGAWLGNIGLSPRLCMLGPSLLAPVVVPVIGALLYLFWSRRDRAWVASLLWLAFATGDLDALRGAGVVPGLWSHPIGALGLVATVAAVVLGARDDRRWIPVGIAVAVAWIAAAAWWGRLGEPVSPTSAVQRVLLVTLDQGLWLPLGWYALLRRGEPASRALALAGLAMLLMPAPVRIEAWGPHALYRLGLIMSASALVAEACATLGAALKRRVSVLSEVSDRRLGIAALLVVLAPGSFLVWWHPVQLDPVMAGSLDRVPAVVVEVAEAVRARTPPIAVVMASEEYAPALAALAGRRVLRAPALAQPDDGDARWTVEEKVLAGHTSDRLVQRYGVSHVLVAPGDFVDRGLARPEDLGRRGPYQLIYQHREGFRLYAISAPPGRVPAF